MFIISTIIENAAACVAVNACVTLGCARLLGGGAAIRTRESAPPYGHYSSGRTLRLRTA